MEKELNIAAILRDKPENTRLWSPIFGDVYLKDVTDVNDNMIRVAHHGVIDTFLNNGKVWVDGNVCLFPSKQMRDWSKFAWKKGDVLASNNVICVFGGFRNDDYTKFNALNAICISPYDNKSEAICSTADFSKVESEKDTKNYLLNSQVIFGNIKFPACDVEKPKQEFKDGDIVTYKCGFEGKDNCILILKNINQSEPYYSYHAILCPDRYTSFKDGEYGIYKRELSLATDSEKYQLFSALAKEGKRWNPDTKTIEDLPKKCELKPFDKVLVRDFGDKEWKLDFFSHKRFIGTDYCFSCVGNMWKYCIPYNEETKHLLGTTDEWEGDNNV